MKRAIAPPKRTMALFLALCVTVSLLPGPASAGEPSPAGAFFRSLLIPGWGQLAQGTHGRAVTFGVLEGVLWLGASGLYVMHDVYRDDYRSMAEGIAGADIRGKDDQFFNDLAFYDSRLLHNQAAYTQDGSEPELYDVGSDWQWPSAEDRWGGLYRDRLNDSKTMKQRFGYAAAIIALNHLASAVDAAKRAAGRRSAAEPEVGFAPSADRGFRAMLSWRLR